MRTFSLLLTGMILSLSAQAKILTDSLQRQVDVPDNPQRIVIGESRMIYTLALVEEGNPAKRIVGWPDDLRQLDKQTWQRYTDAFPAIKQIPLIGKSNFSQLNVEKIIALQPELVILPVYAKTPPNSEELMRQLAAAHIPVLFLDFRVNQLSATVPSLRTLGLALNDEAKSEKFIAFYQSHMDFIRQRLQEANPPKPKVMLQLHLGRKAGCCTTVAHGNLAELIAFAGGNNIAANRFPSVFGQLNPEAVIAANPDIYIATGMAGPDEKGFLQLGPAVSSAKAKETFLDALNGESTVAALGAVQNHKAYAFWQNFYMSPWHLLVVEFFAKTFHPELLHELDPGNTMEEINQQFLTLKETGSYWTNNR
ncbi:ABC transporter substrate-binding protein [Dickeya dadantii]|uniref:ABC transporter substrate-binding protein n=1 Tax=Dickeya dadantii TaxID=204038 RepID=UPI0021DB5A60|nr:ABC transporter substrate-binding protein [Dickeya dadantii]